MRLKINLAILLFWLIHLSAFSQEKVQLERFLQRPSIPIDSISTSDDSTALLLNPAGLSIHPLQAGYFYGHNFTANIQDHTLLLNLFGLAFSTQWRFAPSNGNIRKYTIGTGLGSTRFLSLGFAVNWFDSPDKELDGYRSLDIGLITRPTRYISIGTVGRNLNSSSTNIVNLQHRWDASLSLRPLYFLPKSSRDYYESLTISVEGTWVAGESIRTVNPRYIFGLLPTDGVTLYGGVDHERNLFMGLKFSQNYAQLSFQGDILPEVADGIEGKTSRRGNFYNVGILVGQERFKTKIEAVRYFLEITLDIMFQEKKEDGIFLFDDHISFFELLNLIRRAMNDSQIKGILITGRKFKGGWGQAEELKEALIYFRQGSGKPLISFLENAGNKEYYIASAADYISMPFAGSLTINGLSAELYFVKDLLDKVGIKADFIQVGKYKSAPDTFKRSEPTKFEEEQVLSILADISSEIKESVLFSRRNKVKREEYDEIIQKGLFTAQEALEKGLIDRVEYLEDIKKRVIKVGISPFGWNKSIMDYKKTKFYRNTWGQESKIAIVVLEGDIVSGESTESGIFQTSSVASDSIQKILESIREDGKIKGVIIRINSGGGSSLASDIIWKEINLLKEKKSVIISFSDIAASGGYYIAVGADNIIANRNSITGSIGVFGGKFALGGLYKKLGIEKTIYKTGEKASIFSEKDEFTPAEKMLLEEHLNDFYDLFIQRISRSRKDLNKEEILENADGRVYTGKAAFRKGMIDQNGGIMLAIEILIQKLDLDRNYLSFELYPKKFVGLLDFPLNSSLVLPYFAKKMINLWSRSEKLKEDKVYFLMPYKIDIH